jgi:hypothetical protein
MNATHLLRRAALLTSAVGLAGSALVFGSGTAFAAPAPHDHHHGRHHDSDGRFGRFDNDRRFDNDGRNAGERSTVFEPRHPRQARHWDDDLERCNPNSCWRGFGGHPRGF